MKLMRLMAVIAATAVASCFSVLSFAAESTAQVLPALDMLPGWVGYVVAVLYGFAHAVTLLPASVTGSWPSWLKSGLNLIAANYGKAKNRDG